MADAPESTESAEKSAPGQHPPAVLNDRYVVQVATPLSDLDTPSARAYLVQDRKEESRALFALVVEPGMPVRMNVIKALNDYAAKGLMPMVDHGPIFWPDFGQRVMTIIYERPLGGRLVESPYSDGERMNEYDIPRKILTPLGIALAQIAQAKISHRAVRPDNMYYMDAERQNLVLGDCATTPPGFDQPAVFEPVSRGLASPHGRGDGTVASDYYALAVSLVFLTLGHNPIAKLKDDDMFSKKMELGSYAAICGKARIPVGLLEPIRGMMSDSAAERWGMEELELWLSGKRNTPMQRKPGERSDVPFEFRGREFHTIRGLAIFVAKHISDGAKIIKDGTLAAWVRRHMEKPDLAELIAKAVEDAKANASNMKGTNEHLVAKVCCLMDPVAPMRYKKVSVAPEGFGYFMAFEICRRGNAQIPAELIMSEIPATWIASRGLPGTDVTSMARTFNSIRGFLQIKDPGYGIERCLYEMNKGTPCQSPLVAKDYVAGIADLLPYLDQASNRVDTKAKPMDRHMIAFIAARFDQDIDPHLRALANPREDIALIGMLSLLALLQWKLKAQSLFGLASWIGGLLGPAINTYHSRTTRRDIEREIPKLVRQGSLPDLFDLIDNAEKRRIDHEGFFNARLQYLTAAKEIDEIESDSEARQIENEEKGQKAAATTSVMLCLIVISILILLEVY